jgi:hypothetical protein
MRLTKQWIEATIFRCDSDVYAASLVMDCVPLHVTRLAELQLHAI